MKHSSTPFALIFLFTVSIIPMQRTNAQEVRTLHGHGASVESVAFSPDGSLIISGSWDNTVKLWETETGQVLRTLEGHSDYIKSVAISPDGSRIVSGSRDETIKLWEAETGRELQSLEGHSDWVSSVAFSPDGSRIVSGSFKTIKLWEAETGRELRTLKGHSASIYSVAFSPDGSRIVSGNGDETIKLWALSPKAFVAATVEKRIRAWQQKGKYESAVAYRQRVTEQERNKLVRRYTSQVVDSLGRASFDPSIQKTNYDPDNQIFEVNFTDGANIYVEVPASEAPQFDQNLNRLRFSNTDFALNEEGQLVLSKADIHNPGNDQTYHYDSGREVAFSTAELAANFDPIEVEVETDDGEAKVQKSTKTIEVGKADVDVNIPETNRSNPDAIAVVIGNRRYQGNTPDVDFAVNDAKVMRDYLVKTLGFKPGNILYEENASKSRMEVLLGDDRNPGRLANYLKPGRSDVFFFYSGHGAPDPNTGIGYLMPVDADASALAITGYPLDVLYDNLSKLEARSVSVVIDACFSGKAGGGQMLIQKASPIGIEVRNPAAKLENGFVVTASSGSQVASWYPEKGHGLLTYYWLKGLQGSADLNSDKQITAAELKQYLTDATDGLPYRARRLHNRQQIPQVFGNDEKVLIQYEQ